MTRPHLAAAALLLLALTLAPAAVSETAAQCAMCGTALANSEEGRAMAGEFNRAILLMIFAPYAVAGTFAAVLFRRRLRSFASRMLPRLIAPAPPAA